VLVVGCCYRRQRSVFHSDIIQTSPSLLSRALVIIIIMLMWMMMMMLLVATQSRVLCSLVARDHRPRTTSHQLNTPAQLRALLNSSEPSSPSSANCVCVREKRCAQLNVDFIHCTTHLSMLPVKLSVEHTRSTSSDEM